MKVCAEPGCPSLQPESRCIAHRRERERIRGSRQQRGYGAEHDALRSQWASLVATGNVKCARCAEYIAPDVAWDLDHDDQDRSKYLGPSCAACNRASASRR